MIDLVSASAVAASAAVVVGVGFGALQIGQMSRKRRDAAAVEVVRSVQTPEFARAVRLLWSLPEGADAAALRAEAGFEEAAIAFGTTIETMGVLVYHRVVPLAIVQDLIGGAIVLVWRRTKPYFAELRAAQGRPGAFEWFEWLADRLAEQAPPYKAAGAQVAFRAWRP